MAVVWLAVTRPPMPSRIVSAAMTSTNREWSSSVSSQWMSTRRPLSAASAIANLTDRSPYSRVDIHCDETDDDHVDCLAHQVFAALEREDALLGKGHQLQGHLVTDLLAQLQQGP